MRVVGHRKAWEQAISSAARSFEPHYLNEAPRPIFQAVVELAAMGYLTTLGKPFSALNLLGGRVDPPSADPKPPRAAAAKSRGGERRGNVGTMIPAGMVERGERKRTAAEASKAD